MSIDEFYGLLPHLPVPEDVFRHILTFARPCHVLGRCVPPTAACDDCGEILARVGRPKGREKHELVFATQVPHRVYLCLVDDCGRAGELACYECRPDRRDLQFCDCVETFWQDDLEEWVDSPEHPGQWARVGPTHIR